MTYIIINEKDKFIYFFASQLNLLPVINNFGSITPVVAEVDLYKMFSYPSLILTYFLGTCIIRPLTEGAVVRSSCVIPLIAQCVPFPCKAPNKPTQISSNCFLVDQPIRFTLEVKTI